MFVENNSVNGNDPFGCQGFGFWNSPGGQALGRELRPVQSAVDNLNSGREKPPPSDWNPSGQACVLAGRHIGGYVGAGGQGGNVTLLFDNGYAQDYQYIGGGAGFGGFLLSITMGGRVYGVYQPADFAGPFTSVSFAWWTFYGWPGGSGRWSWELGLPGISGSYQGYWMSGSPYRYGPRK